MTVRKSERTPTSVTLKVQDVAYKLYAYTAHAASNEKIVPKRLRWCTGQFLVSAASAICRNIDLANTMRLDDANEAVWRRKYQSLALGGTYNLLTELHKAYYTHRFDDDKLCFWVEQIEEAQRLLKAWMKSDAAKSASGGGGAV